MTLVASTRNGPTALRRISKATGRRFSPMITTSITSKWALSLSERRFSTVTTSRSARRSPACGQPYARAAISGGLWLGGGYATDPLRTGEAVASDWLFGERSVLHQRSNSRRQHLRNRRVRHHARPDIRRRGEDGDAARGRDMHGKVDARKGASRHPVT